MNKHIASLLCIDYTQLTNFGPIVSRNVQQSSISNLTAHLGVERRPINDDIEFVRLLARENRFNDYFCLQKIISKKFRRLGFQLSLFDTNFLLFLSLAGALTLLLHQLFEPCHTHPQTALSRN